MLDKQTSRQLQSLWSCVGGHTAQTHCEEHVGCTIGVIIQCNDYVLQAGQRTLTREAHRGVDNIIQYNRRPREMGWRDQEAIKWVCNI